MMRQSRPMSDVNQVVVIVEEDFDTALDGYNVRSAGSASMGVAIPSGLNGIVEMSQFQQRRTSSTPALNDASIRATLNALDASSSHCWPHHDYRYRYNFQSSFGSQSSSLGSEKSDSSSNSVYARQGSIEIHEDDCEDFALDLTLSKFSLSSSDSKTLTSGGF